MHSFSVFYYSFTFQENIIETDFPERLEHFLFIFFPLKQMFLVARYMDSQLIFLLYGS